ncbi:MAG TPA: sigma-70 family RNA polymerase sigma factor [Solirubrobacteraceae bacterium]|jgi:RNA polymerase sigma-70 factor (ECF subfamily)|nr:sigma-70 family RNA polymerase sigma factor [Solirubrobacteraceae bacterium]
MSGYDAGVPVSSHSEISAERRELSARLAELHRSEWPQLVATLARRFRSLDIAEEAASEAFLAAIEHWHGGLPPNPGGWLMTTANRRAIDRLRRDSGREQKYAAALVIGSRGVTTDMHQDEPNDAEPDGPVSDDRLRLMFTCCHPALAREAQVALTLRMVGGLTVEQIARGLLKSEAAVAQRITRAKAKIEAAGIPYRIPEEGDLAERVDAVLAVLYLVFNEGYLPGGERELRPELSGEAIRISRLLCELMPATGEAQGLLALMLMTEARRPSRISSDGELVVLADQDRGAWNGALIAEGHAIVLELIAGGSAPGRYQLQAAINAVHTYARDIRDTDWSQLSILYDQLYAINPSPVVALNRAIVTAELDGPVVALADIDRLELEDYHAWHAARADLLRRLGRSADARAAYEQAIVRAVNPAEIRFLKRRQAGLAG